MTGQQWKSPQEIAAEALPTYVGDSDTSDGFDFDDMRTFAVVAIEKDRAQRPGAQRIVEAWEEFDGQDVSGFFHAWDGHDTLCPESPSGIHQDSDGSCDLCGEKNRG